MNMYDQPTTPSPQQGNGGDVSAQDTQAGQVVPDPSEQTEPRGRSALTASLSRRKFMGKSLAAMVAIGGAGIGAAAGGAALEQWLSHGGWNSLFHGPMASNMQTGHLLRRAGFGATSSDLQTYSSLGFNGAVDRLLNYSQVSDDDLENRLKTLNLDLNTPTDQQRWWLLRMAWTQRPLLEKMTLFWHGVLTSSFHKVGGKKNYMRMIIQNQFLRNHAFDTFDNIMLGITADPAMLFYLDLTKSRKNAPNENYAREMMELFTLGLGHYTQRDVSEGAAALTGWHVKGLTSTYNPLDHNDLTKYYLGHTGNLDYKDVVHILTNHPATPWFISRKLFTFFVYENPSTDDLKPLVDTYVESGHNMGAVMRTLLLSPQFSSTKAYRSRLKSPVEFTVGAYRAMNIGGDGTGLPAITTLMGQTLFDPPNVAGWPGDKVSSFWLNSGTWMTRLNYIDLLLARGTLARKGTTPLVDLQGVVNTNQIGSPEHFVDHFSTFLLDGTIESDRRTQLLDYFTASDGNGRGGQIALTGGKSYPLNRVRGTLYLMMASPEYQLN
ncbi:MAG TPA: DUF1800 domain-containing protein [Ktedonobacteraceae bacterium]|nr:DUF1800 domain-containing protein [Ktedonobacteraceae bacterium]